MKSQRERERERELVKNRIINKASKWEGDPQSAHRLFSESKSLCCVVLGVVVVEVSVEYLVIYIYIERERERESGPWPPGPTSCRCH